MTKRRIHPAWAVTKTLLHRENVDWDVEPDIFGLARHHRLYGAGDSTWQWRDWNEWVAAPMISRNDDNTMFAYV